MELNEGSSEVDSIPSYGLVVQAWVKCHSDEAKLRQYWTILLLFNAKNLQNAFKINEKANFLISKITNLMQN